MRNVYDSAIKNIIKSVINRRTKEKPTREVGFFLWHFYGRFEPRFVYAAKAACPAFLLMNLQSEEMPYPARRATSSRASHSSRRFFYFINKPSHRLVSPLLLSASDLACCGCSLVNAFATPSRRYQSFAGKSTYTLFDNSLEYSNSGSYTRRKPRTRHFIIHVFQDRRDTLYIFATCPIVSVRSFARKRFDRINRKQTRINTSH